MEVDKWWLRPSKAHWELLHDWWVEDFAFEVKSKQLIILALRMKPDSLLRKESLRLINLRIEFLQREYKKIYGCRFNLNRLKKD